MTFAPPEVSRAATRRIGAANAVLWVVGSIILVIVAATSAYAYVIVPYGGGYLGGAYYPWEADQPLVATQTDDVWSADAAGVIRIPAAEFTVPLRAVVVGSGAVELYRTDPADQPDYAGDVVRPNYIGYVSSDADQLIVPSVDDLELWVGAAGAWQLRLTPIEMPVVDDDGMSGTGNAYLLYTGDAVSARFTFVGEGVFFVTIYTSRTTEYPITELGDVDQRISWDPDSYVVIEIESEQGAWSIDIDQLAESTPSPTPTPTPTESP